MSETEALAHLPSVDAETGWRAELELEFARSGARTILAHRRHFGPLAVQRPFHPEGPVCHVYLLHPPGGVVAGDRLAIRIAAGEGAEALATTPAAGKFYRSEGRAARQSVHLKVASGASLEWLPQETILYEDARAALDLEVDLAPGARFFGWEVFSLGRPAAGEDFGRGEAALSWRIQREGRPFFRERLRVDRAALDSPWGLRGHSAFGTLFASPADAASLDRVRELIGDRPGIGATLVDGLLICRGVDERADRLRRFFETAWAALRPHVLGRDACPPRIWAT
jgi:urease accessory protein